MVRCLLFEKIQSTFNHLQKISWIVWILERERNKPFYITYKNFLERVFEKQTKTFRTASESFLDSLTEKIKKFALENQSKTLEKSHFYLVLLKT